MNAQALAFWQELLVAGRQIPITGGSDFHLKNRRRHGHPSNRLQVTGTSIADILAAVRAGRNVVSFSPHDLTAEPVGAGHPDFGSRVPAATPIAVSFAGLANGDEIRIVDETGSKETLRPEAGQVTVEARLSGRFLRFEVWHGEEARLFTNPFYAE